jgi:hypothetical protein
VGEVTPEKVELILRPNFMIEVGPAGEIPPDREHINARFSKSLSIENGTPVLKDEHEVSMPN